MRVNTLSWEIPSGQTEFMFLHMLPFDLKLIKYLI